MHIVNTDSAASHVCTATLCDKSESQLVVTEIVPGAEGIICHDMNMSV